ncbi:MAG: Hsp20/alpha crystallin family protein [Syntrophotaleaceae bacterium]
MADRNVTVRSENTPSGVEEVSRPERYSRPPVDIFETEDSLTLVADLPGVEKDRLDIHLEKGILTISGRVMPTQGPEVLAREFSLIDYYRQFQVPSEIDADRVSADFKNGVLTLSMPKSEAAKPRRIEIRH